MDFIDRLLPAQVNSGFSMAEWWVWCGSAVRGPDGRYHLFAARWPRSLPFLRAYPLRSEVVRAVADTPAGPYAFAEVVLPPRGEQYWDGRMTHNPTIHMWNGRYYLFYIGSTYAGPPPADDENLDTDEWGRRSLHSWLRIRIGLAVADHPEGPWQRFDKPVLDVRPGAFDRVLVTNPAPCIRQDGSVLLVYRTPGAEFALLGVAGADRPLGPYRRLHDEPILYFGATSERYVEDPYVWWAGDHYEMLAKDLTGKITGERHAGIHAISADGIDWALSDPAKAYSRRVRWSDGTLTEQGYFERPQLLLEHGVPTHLLAATADGPGGGCNPAHRTWTIVIPLKPNRAKAEG